MHVGLNLVFLVPGETGGMETYARELIAALAERDDLRLTAFVNREAALVGGPWSEAAEMELVPVHARSRAQWVWGEQRHLPALAARSGCAVVHSLASTAPLRGPFARVTTVHDLNYKLVPESHFGVNGLGMRVLVPAAVRRSDRVIAVSHSTRRDLVEHLGVRPEKVDVVAQGVRLREAPDRPRTTALRAALDLGDRPIVLSPSAKRPHKNLQRLIAALATFQPAERPVLVVPGYPTPHEAELRAAAARLGVEDCVRFPAWLSQPDMEALYAAAACVVFPSLYEGFGLPVVEAMARGVPVACSDRSSLPEVAGGAALLFDPEDAGAIGAAMRRLLEDGALRGRLAEAGRARAAELTWERTADLTAASYRRALTESS